MEFSEVFNCRQVQSNQINLSNEMLGSIQEEDIYQNYLLGKELPFVFKLSVGRGCPFHSRLQCLYR